LIKKGLIKGMAHITGGGLLENLPRSLPKGVGASVTGHPPLPNVFKWMKEASGLDDHEMLRTFNCGIGMVLILDQKNIAEAKEMLMASGEKEVFDLGALVDTPGVTVTSALL
jgi:phosphoribosylaminoimidazole (AIR) synthetase